MQRSRPPHHSSLSEPRPPEVCNQHDSSLPAVGRFVSCRSFFSSLRHHLFWRCRVTAGQFPCVRTTTKSLLCQEDTYRQHPPASLDSICFDEPSGYFDTRKPAGLCPRRLEPHEGHIGCLLLGNYQEVHIYSADCIILFKMDISFHRTSAVCLALLMAMWPHHGFAGTNAYCSSENTGSDFSPGKTRLHDLYCCA